MKDTIFALATAPGRSAVAVIRLSGQGTRSILKRVVGGTLRPRVASLRDICDLGGECLDRGLVLWFPGPASFTGEDCAELHLHGGAAIIDGVTETLLTLGARLAEPGEFTRRSFEHGKLNLDQAEAVADLIEAETSAQARQAVAQLGGALGRRYETWRRLLVEALALLEAGVDFPDEEIPPEVAWMAKDSIARLVNDIDVGLDDGQRGQRVREGYRVAIVGAPNAGKSSLLNALVNRPAAIVTETPGTTRDVIEAPLVISGYKVILADMAGIRDATDPIEAEGVHRAKAWANSADLRLWVIDGAVANKSWREAAPSVRTHDLCIVNKSDLAQGADGREAVEFSRQRGLEVLHLSIVGDGPGAVRPALQRRVVTDLAGADFPAATRERHRRHLCNARNHLVRAMGALQEPELAAEDVRLAARELERVSGCIGAEDVLDRVFASFCIGK